MASIRGQFLGGESVVFDGVATVGDVMLRVARDEHRFASDVVVLPVGSGEVLEHGRTPPPDVCVVLKKEEDKLSAEECQTNVTLHAEAEDTTTVVRALAMLEDVSPDTRWPENMLLKAARDPTKEKTVRTLVRAGVDGGSAMYCVSTVGDAAAAQRLIDAGLKVDNCSNAFRQASSSGHIKVVQIFIEARADVDSSDDLGWSALRHASCNGREEVVQILIEARANVNSWSDLGRSALWHASRIGRKEVVQILMDAGAAPLSKRSCEAATAPHRTA
eukprot:GEMP01067495.1.p1 GENE.GEMP01067495.1~~GEMP01067495.1.p1  ORF type:complete len:275 (-),score=86.38 GEMP01067495.1:135-959(-)